MSQLTTNQVTSQSKPPSEKSDSSEEDDGQLLSSQGKGGRGRPKKPQLKRKHRTSSESPDTSPVSLLRMYDELEERFKHFQQQLKQLKQQQQQRQGQPQPIRSIIPTLAPLFEAPLIEENEKDIINVQLIDFDLNVSPETNTDNTAMTCENEIPEKTPPTPKM